MKTLAMAVVALLSGCTAEQQQRFADGYFGEPGHTFHEAMFGKGNTGSQNAAYYPTDTTLDDVENSIEGLKEQQHADAIRAQEQAEWDAMRLRHEIQNQETLDRLQSQ